MYAESLFMNQVYLSFMVCCCVFHVTASVVVKAIHRSTFSIRIAVCDYVSALQNFNGALS